MQVSRQRTTQKHHTSTVATGPYRVGEFLAGALAIKRQFIRFARRLDQQTHVRPMHRFPVKRRREIDRLYQRHAGKDTDGLQRLLDAHALQRDLV